MSDAISHSVLPGIVLGFLLGGTLSSPLLMIGAVVMGMITVIFTEAISKTQLLKNDAAIGIVFPALFSIGVILVSLYTGNIHLDTDAVLLGELAFAPFNRFEVGGMDLGPQSLWVMGSILAINLTLLLFFFKEIKIATFDPGLSAALGFSPALIHYVLMVDVSVTAVGAFDAVGSILVVALMIAPGAAAYLLTDRLGFMVAYAMVIGSLSAVLGFWVAIALDGSIAGGIAGVAGLIFFFIFLGAPQKGLIPQMLTKRRQKLDFGLNILLVHLLNHQGSPEENTECHRDHLKNHIKWDSSFARTVVNLAQQKLFVNENQGILTLTAEGQKQAVRNMEV